MFIYVIFLLIIILISKKNIDNFVNFNDNKEFLSNKFKVKLSEYLNNNNDLGVYANKNYKKNETIEISPLLKINKDNCDNLIDYIFKYKNIFYMSFGYIPLINHSEDKYNCLFEILNKKTIKMYAIKPIKKGDELLTHYGDDYFTSREITPK